MTYAVNRDFYKMNPRYNEGQRVRITALIDGFGRQDPRVKDWFGKTGEVVKSYYVSGDEIWEKTLKFEDTYCYNILLDGDGDIVRWIPEVGLETHLPHRS